MELPNSWLISHSDAILSRFLAKDEVEILNQTQWSTGESLAGGEKV